MRMISGIFRSSWPCRWEGLGFSDPTRRCTRFIAKARFLPEGYARVLIHNVREPHRGVPEGLCNAFSREDQ